MPYIITTTTYPPGSPMPSGQSRRAVATLGEAQEWIAQTYFPGALDAWADEIAAIAYPSGGTVGPLPDGTVIQAERIEWSRLATLVGIGGARSWLVDAYNHAQAQS